MSEIKSNESLTWDDVLIDYWHTHDTGNSLCEFLGLTEDEYEKYLKPDGKLKIVIQSESKNKPLTIDKLLKMNGEPVWDEEDQIWGIVTVDEIGRWKHIPFLMGVYLGVEFNWAIEQRELTLYRNKINKKSNI